MLCMTDHPCFFVLERNMVIAQDVVEALREHAPNAIVVSAESIGAAIRQVGPLNRVTAAFVAAPAERVISSGLGAEIEARGGQVVLCGTDAPENGVQARAWLHMQRPFTSEMVQQVARDAAMRHVRCACA